MTCTKNIAAIYDFELFPFALGDVLTWNVRTAMRCVELGRDNVDIYICADERYPAGVHQRGIINSQNFDLFFSELYGAFGTHPRLGNIHIFRQREALIARLQQLVEEDDVNAEAVRDYLGVLNYRVFDSVPNRARRKLMSSIRGNRLVRKIYDHGVPAPVKNTVRNAFLPNEEVINNYFTKYIYSHDSINAFASRRGGIPLLQPSLGCVPDVDELITRRFAGKKLVPFHLRLRRLDGGYGGEHSYTRDSDFLEWYDFLAEASRRYPEVEFIALGRLQEKPLELLRLSNVTSLRIFGMGLGHELTLMLKSDLFIGTSSGFAALANFSSLPYFITRMNPGSCQAYAIPEGAEHLPFAPKNQKLIYEQETSELLMNLLIEGLALPARQPSVSQAGPRKTESAEIDVRSWLNARLKFMNSAATTGRFFTDDKYRLAETAYLLFLNLERARQALLKDERDEAESILRRIEKNFPEIYGQLPQCHVLNRALAAEGVDRVAMRAHLESLDIQVSGFVGAVCTPSATEDSGWRPHNWIVTNAELTPLDEPQPALTIRSTGNNTYWHTEQFVSTRSDGKIIVRFDAKNSVSSSLHRIFLFEDTVYHSVGEFVAENEWRTFDVPITTKLNSILELQVDQCDASQQLSIRNFRVVDGGPLPLVRKTPVDIPMTAWTGDQGPACAEATGGNCRQWVTGRQGYVQSPLLPPPGEAGLLVSFEARTDRPVTSFTALYLFEGSHYRTVAQYAFSSMWRTFELLLQPSRNEPIKIQVDFPGAVEILSIRNFVATPVDRV